MPGRSQKRSRHPKPSWPARRRPRCPKAVIGRRVALRATATDGVFDLCYRRHVLSTLDLRQNVVKSVRNVPEHPSTCSQV